MPIYDSTLGHSEILKKIRSWLEKSLFKQANPMDKNHTKLSVNSRFMRMISTLINFNPS